jgi:GABA(A) receptor-associated protein
MTSQEKNFSKGDIEKLLLKHPDHVPIITYFDKNLKQFRFIVKSDLTIMEFLAIFRRRVNLNSQEALWLYVTDKNNKNQVILPPTSSSLSSLYEQYKDDKLVLRFQVEKENTFG